MDLKGSNTPQQDTATTFSEVYGNSINLGFEGVKHVTTLSAGSTVLIATFLRDIFPKLSNLGPGIRVTISAAFVAFGLSLVFACYSLGGLAIMSRRRRDFRSPRSRRRYRRYVALPLFFFVSGLLLFSMAVVARFFSLKFNFATLGNGLLVGTFSAVLLGFLGFIFWYLILEPRRFAPLTMEKLYVGSKSPPQPVDNCTPTLQATVSDKHTRMPPLDVRLFVDKVEHTDFKYDCHSGLLTCDRVRLGVGGKHTVEVVAVDAEGKQTTAESVFRGIRCSHGAYLRLRTVGTEQKDNRRRKAWALMPPYSRRVTPSPHQPRPTWEKFTPGPLHHPY